MGTITIENGAIVVSGSQSFDEQQLATIKENLTQDDVEYLTQLHADVGALSTAEESIMQTIATLRDRIAKLPDVQQLRAAERKMKLLKDQRREKNIKAMAIMEKGLRHRPGKTLGEKLIDVLPDVADKPRGRKALPPKKGK